MEVIENWLHDWDDPDDEECIHKVVYDEIYDKLAILLSSFFVNPSDDILEEIKKIRSEIKFEKVLFDFLMEKVMKVKSKDMTIYDYKDNYLGKFVSRAPGSRYFIVRMDKKVVHLVMPYCSCHPEEYQYKVFRLNKRKRIEDFQRETKKRKIKTVKV